MLTVSCDRTCLIFEAVLMVYGFLGGRRFCMRVSYDRKESGKKAASRCRGFPNCNDATRIGFPPLLTMIKKKLHIAFRFSVIRGLIFSYFSHSFHSVVHILLCSFIATCQWCCFHFHGLGEGKANQRSSIKQMGKRVKLSGRYSKERLGLARGELRICLSDVPS